MPYGSRCKARWSQYGMLTLGVEFGVRDKEKEGFLEQVGNIGRKRNAGISITGGNRCFWDSPQAFRHTIRPEGKQTAVDGRKQTRMEILRAPAFDRSQDTDTAPVDWRI